MCHDGSHIQGRYFRQAFSIRPSSIERLTDENEVVMKSHLSNKYYWCSFHWCSVNGICKWSDTLWPASRVPSFADYAISLSSLCRLIWSHWTNKMFVRYMLPSVCRRLRQFSQLSFIQYMGLCVFSLLNSYVMIARMCTLSYYHHQIGSMNHCLWLGHETMIYAVCLCSYGTIFS